MTALLFGLLLVLAPPDSTADRDSCLDLLPVRASSELPITSLSEAQRSWTEDTDVSPEVLRSYVAQVEAATDCFRNLPPSERGQPYRDVIRSLRWEAYMHAGLRQFSEAFAAYDEALSHLDKELLPPDSAEAVRVSERSGLHQERGYLHFLLGNLSEALTEYISALEATPADRESDRVKFLLDVGILHQRTQDYASARHYFGRAERLFRESPLSVETHAATWARVLSVQADLGLEETLNTKYDSAALERARSLAQRGRAAAEPGTERHARVSLKLSESLGYLEDFEQAYRLNEEVRKYARTNGEPRLRTFALLKLGLLHVQTEHFARADTVLHEALDLAENLGDLDYQRRIYRALGRLHELEERWAEAEHYFREGVVVIEEYRESLTATQWSTTAFAQWRDVHRGLVRALLAQNQPREALAVLDRSRARHLQDLRTQARVANQLPPHTRTRFDSLTRELTRVRNRLGSTPSTDEQARLRNEEARLMAARQQVLQIDSAASRPSLDALSEALARQDRALVSYFLDDPWPVYDRSPRSVAFVLTADTLRTVSLSGLTQDSIQAEVEAISPLFTSQGKPNRTNAMHFNLRPLSRLYTSLYRPVVEHLPDAQPLTVVPDGPLFHLPFSMLVESMPDGRFAPASAHFVLHERATSLELASSLVADTSFRARDWSMFDPQMAAYGVSDFDTLQTVPSALRTALPEGGTDSGLNLPPLPGVREELNAVGSSINDAKVALNGQATEAAFCQSIQQAGILHVASHAFVNSSSPLQNAILLRPDSTGQSSSDGVLFLHELQDQRSHIPLVVLSGCSTAKGTLRGGEGMEGLQYAFRAMGAQSTISTLWPVADEASVELMNAFYQNLGDGHSKDEALRQAQLAYLENHPEAASPFFWAPPVLYGSPAALPIESSSPVPAWLWWGGPLFGGAVILGLLLWRPTGVPRSFVRARPQ